MADSTLEMWDKAEARFADIYARYDEDRDLAYLTAYTLTDSEGKAIKETVPITLNDPAVLLNTITSALMGAIRQPEVIGQRNGKPMTERDANKIEEFVQAAFEQADDLLAKRFETTLQAFAVNHLCLRGASARRVWSYADKAGNYVPDILPLDMRFVRYAVGRDGLIWAGYIGRRTPESIYEEYGKVIADSSDVDVICVNTKEDEEVWIKKELISTKKHSWSYVPVVIQLVPSGFSLRDIGYQAHEGEGLFFLNRDLFAENNRIASIEATLALKTVLPPYQIPRSDMGGKPAPYPDKAGKVTEVPVGEEYKLLPVADMNRAAQLARVDLQGAAQRGGVNNIDLGNVSTPTSAVWITVQSELRNKILFPRLQALDFLDQQTAYMLIDQFKNGGFEGEVGRRGMKVSVTPAEMEGDFTFRYRSMTKTREQEIANLAMAQAARGILPEKVILRDVLLAENPDELMAALESQRAEEIDPVIGIIRRAHALVDEAEDMADEKRDAKLIESMMLTERAVQVLESRMMPQPPATTQEPEPVENKPNSNVLVPLLGAGMRGGGGGGNGARQPEVEA